MLGKWKSEKETEAERERERGERKQEHSIERKRQTDREKGEISKQTSNPKYPEIFNFLKNSVEKGKAYLLLG